MTRTTTIWTDTVAANAGDVTGGDPRHTRAADPLSTPMTVPAAAQGAANVPAADRERRDGVPHDTDDEQTFEGAIVPLMPALLRYFVRRVPREDADDCLSETLMAMWRHRNRLPGPADDRRAWAYGFARRVAANHYRKLGRRREVRLAADVPTDAPTPSTEADRAITALATLREADQELIRLIVWDGFGVAEAGRVLGLREATARSRYARAKARLRAAMDAGR